MPSDSNVLLDRAPMHLSRRQQLRNATEVARSLTSLLPASYMDYLYAIIRQSGISMEQGHKVIAQLEHEGFLRWNAARGRLMPTSA